MSFEVLTPHTLDEALNALAAGDAVLPLAGGTDIMVSLEAGMLSSSTFLNLQELEQLKPALSIDGSLTLGALTTYRDVRLSPIRVQFPMLAWAAREVGALAIKQGHMGRKCRKRFTRRRRRPCVDGSRCRD